MSIIQIKGNVRYNITIDPSVWIFDDRKFLMDSFFEKKAAIETDQVESELDQERVIREGQTLPPTLKTEKKFEKERLITGSFGMKLGEMLKNAEPLEQAETCEFVTETETVVVPLSSAMDSIAHFSQHGKPITEEGPIHVYFADQPTLPQPIKGVKELIIT
ncbi:MULTISPECIES: peptidyl-prolyl cis-trans isomerase [unclassified Bacillus (in: firmicutes)]|uniref:peptidyl-prolyl cis-trans isomerase n=1 Tax=Bacillus TaxID=1386 RepID=UPI00338F2551